MEMQDLKLDGNAAAGALQTVFAVEITGAAGTCAHCGAVELVGAVAVYSQAPGIVLRCPHCDGVLLKLATDGERCWLDLRGVSTLEVRL
jgi:Zn finger protein HypA/HybF involved in hydrogenase expression